MTPNTTKAQLLNEVSRLSDIHTDQARLIEKQDKIILDLNAEARSLKFTNATLTNDNAAIQEKLNTLTTNNSDADTLDKEVRNLRSQAEIMVDTMYNLSEALANE